MAQQIYKTIAEDRNEESDLVSSVMSIINNPVR